MSTLPFVQIKTSDDRRIRLFPGAIIGRLFACDVQFNDPSVSEAHAMISLRGNRLKLLQLRRQLKVNGEAYATIDLKVGQRVCLSPTAWVEIELVVSPSEIICLRGIGDDDIEFSESVYSILRPQDLVNKLSRRRVVAMDDSLALYPDCVPRALAHIWSADEEWMIRLAESGATEPFASESRWSLGGKTIQAVLRTRRLDENRTQVSPPLTIIARYDTVEIRTEGLEGSFMISGMLARLLTELVSLRDRGPVHWSVVAQELWPTERELLALRPRWDRTIRRLRSQLTSIGVNTDLVRLVGRGQIEIHLRDCDTVIEDF